MEKREKTLLTIAGFIIFLLILINSVAIFFIWTELSQDEKTPPPAPPSSSEKADVPPLDTPAENPEESSSDDEATNSKRMYVGEWGLSFDPKDNRVVDINETGIPQQPSDGYVIYFEDEDCKDYYVSFYRTENPDNLTPERKYWKNINGNLDPFPGNDSPQLNIEQVHTIDGIRAVEFRKSFLMDPVQLVFFQHLDYMYTLANTPGITEGSYPLYGELCTNEDLLPAQKEAIYAILDSIQFE